jgi:hypothetical protein
MPSAPVVAAAAAAAAAMGSGAFSRDEIRAIVRVAIDEALTPMQHLLRDVEQRLSDLEHRPRVEAAPHTHAVHTAAIAAAAPPAAPSAPGPHPAAIAPPPARQPLHSIPAALTPKIDLAAIEKNVKLDDAELSMMGGRSRKRRNVILLVLILLAIFGGMAYMLARSYMPHTD